MAQYTLTDLRSAACLKLGYGATYSALDATRQAEVDRVVRRGLRNFYFPPTSTHVWAFLKKTGFVTLNTVGGGAYSNNYARSIGRKFLFTHDSGTKYYFRLNEYLFLTADGASYASAPAMSTAIVAAINASTNQMASKLTASTNLAGALFINGDSDETGIRHSITCTAVGGIGDVTSSDFYSPIDIAVWDAPSDFAEMLSEMQFDTHGSYNHVVQSVDESYIYQMRAARGTNITGCPMYYALRPKQPVVTEYTGANPSSETVTQPTELAGSAAQKYEFIFWPIPDQAYTLNFQYRINPPELTATYPYHLGGEANTETVMMAVEASAEMHVLQDRSGPIFEMFRRQVEASIQADGRNDIRILSPGDNMWTGVRPRILAT